MKNISKHQFQKLVIKSTSKETSAVPEIWNSDNPTLGHCAIVALLVQEIYGGQILRVSLEKTEFEYLKSHYWNLLSSGEEVDFTKAQFKKSELKLVGETRARKKLLKNKQTKIRYELFKKNFEKTTSLFRWRRRLEDQDYLGHQLFLELDQRYQ